MASGHKWLTVLGNNDETLAEKLSALVADRVQAKKYGYDDVAYIKRIDRSIVHTIADSTSGLSIGVVRLQKLRRLCQLWEVEVKVGEITSHRKVIGPIIVGFKRLLVPMMRILLKDTLRQQRDFNAAVILLLADLTEEVERSKKVL